MEARKNYQDALPKLKEFERDDPRDILEHAEGLFADEAEEEKEVENGEKEQIMEFVDELKEVVTNNKL